MGWLYRWFVDKDQTVDWVMEEIDSDKSGSLDIFELAIWLRTRDGVSFSDSDVEKF